MIYFICGCCGKVDPPIDREVFKTHDSIVEDHEGFLVCLTHHERLRGWRSVPYTTVNMPPGMATADWTPLEWERWRIFGEFPPRRNYSFSSTVPDRRDNRDPEQVGNEYLAAMAVARNGEPEEKKPQLSDSQFRMRPPEQKIPPPGPARWGSD